MNIEQLKQTFDYNPNTGELKRKIKTSNSAEVDAPVGNRRKSYGHMVTKFEGKSQKVHVICWMIFHGKEVPEGYVIDHRNCNTADNRIENLRLATPSQNAHNASKRKDNSSGYKGVSFFKPRSKWRGYVAHNKRTICVGYFDTPEQANEAVMAKREELHGKFANHG